MQRISSLKHDILCFPIMSTLKVTWPEVPNKKIVSFKIYNVTRKFYEYSDYTPSLNDICILSILSPFNFLWFSNIPLIKVGQYVFYDTIFSI